MLLSIALFKLIPKAVNQLATASLTLTGGEKATTTVPVTVDRNPQPVATTTGGLNGAVTNSGTIVISPNKTTTPTPVKTTYVPTKTYYPTYLPAPVKSGRKNIKVVLSSIGVIDRYTGQYRVTNTFDTSDTVSVRYIISNSEDTDTGLFSMRVEMPATNSNDQVRYINNLNIEGNSAYSVEARFDGINTTYSPAVRIYTDVNNQIAETNEGDNTLTVNLNSNNNNNGNNGNNGNNCYYSNGTYYNCNNNNGNANLIVTAIETGKMVNGNFYSQTSFSYGDTIGIRMRVRNTGGTFSNYWSTRASFYDSTTNNPRNFDTGSQAPLGAGNETSYTFQADGLARGTVTINVIADSNGNVSETNEGDNSSTATVYVY